MAPQSKLASCKVSLSLGVNVKVVSIDDKRWKLHPLATSFEQFLKLISSMYLVSANLRQTMPETRNSSASSTLSG
jgi:hypothetical protein